jgi:LPXTG-site transpeptidase (sortase) family protein
MLDARNKKSGPKKSRWRRSWQRWLADLMILGGVVALAYVPGTWACTWYEQRGLREDFVQANPAITASTATASTIRYVDPQVMAEAKHKAELESLKNAADAYALSVSNKAGTPIGQILIPSINVDVIMVEGVGKSDLKEGPGHWPETPFPGQGGNFVVSGHRTTYGKPFYNLDKVKVGDEITLVFPYAVVTYSVTENFVVFPDEVETVGQQGIEEVSLAACHPWYSAKQRIVVKGEMTSFQLLGVYATTTTSTTEPGVNER